MRVQEKRIFISDLPETATEDEIRNALENYGTIKSIEIKERKELGPKNTSLFFAYINIEIDDQSLQQCFHDFPRKKWCGQFVQLQIARESFLDRLRREREETGTQNNNIEKIDEKPVLKPKIIVKKKVESSESSDSSSESSESEDEVKTPVITKKVESEPEVSDLIIKNNKGKQLNKNGLKIESVGKEPILTIDMSKKKANVSQSEANLKRLQSMNEMRKGYKSQKQLIAAALAKVDVKQTKNNTVINEDNKKAKLFDDDDDEEIEPNFELKEQFEGKKGQKLLELQSKYKNDKRFQLDKRFVDDEENQTVNGYHSEEEINLEEEKRRQFEILGEVLGKRIAPKTKESTENPKKMLRFDPSRSDHSKYELKNDDIQPTSKRKRKISEEIIEKPEPEVSKEIFYKVTDNLKDTLHEKQEFSLLSMFGRSDTIEEKQDEENIEKPVNKVFGAEKNPFKYDSSDDEDETEAIPNSTEIADKEIRPTRLWTESFFFKEDDFRLQEGFDFIEKMRTEDKGEFGKLRRELKEIVRSKVRNNQRKDKPFKKKLGGNKKRKVIRMKKALKR